MNATTTPHVHTRIRRTLALATVALLGLAACGSDDAGSVSTDATTDTTADTTVDEAAPAGGITMTDPWSREPADGQTATAVYGQLTNNTDAAITAVSATTSVTDTVELHEVLMNDEGQMAMQEKEGGFEIGPGETFDFEPGGPHIMMLGIDPATYPESVDVTLSFDDGSSVDFSAEVRTISGDAMGEMDDSPMDDSSMDETMTTEG